jgi:hypothetical protein
MAVQVERALGTVTIEAALSAGCRKGDLYFEINHYFLKIRMILKQVLGSQVAGECTKLRSTEVRRDSRFLRGILFLFTMQAKTLTLPVAKPVIFIRKKTLLLWVSICS